MRYLAKDAAIFGGYSGLHSLATFVALMCSFCTKLVYQIAILGHTGGKGGLQYYIDVCYRDVWALYGPQAVILSVLVFVASLVRRRFPLALAIVASCVLLVLDLSLPTFKRNFTDTHRTIIAVVSPLLTGIVLAIPIERLLQRWRGLTGKAGTEV